jgi:hypothetical protein
MHLSGRIPKVDAEGRVTVYRAQGECITRLDGGNLRVRRQYLLEGD